MRRLYLFLSPLNSSTIVKSARRLSVLGHAQFHKERVKGDDAEINTAQNPKRFEGHLAILEKIRKTFTDSIPNKQREGGKEGRKDLVRL